MDNLKSFKELCSKYSKNKEGLGFSITISSCESENVLKVEFLNLDPKYKKALTSLVDDIIKEANNYIANEYRISFLKEDEQFEYLRFDKEMRSEYSYLIYTLLNDGLDSFLKAVSYLSIKYKQLYELANVTFVNGKLLDRHGREIA